MKHRKETLLVMVKILTFVMIVLLPLGATFIFNAPQAQAYGQCSTFTNCFRDSDCGGVGGFCRNRVCQCPANEAPAVCGDRCATLPYCPPGVTSCGGHSVQVNGSTVHVTDCRGISSGAGGGVISYCTQSAPPQIGVLTGSCTTVGGRAAVQLNWTSDYRADSNGLQKGDSYPSDGGNFWGWLPTTVSQRAYTDSTITPGTEYSYRVKYQPALPSNVVNITCPATPPPTLTLTANPTSVTSGNATTLSWTSTNATSCTASSGAGTWAGFKPTNGSFSTPALTSATSFTLSCSGSGGSTSRTVTIGVTAPTPTPTPPSLGNGQITGRCIGWPNPRIEIQWSSNPPPGSAPKNSNSVLKYIDGGSGGWFYGGGYPGVDAYRINGVPAPAWGAGGYPNPNYGVYDLRDTNIQAGQTYSYKAKYRPETPSINTYQVTVNQTNCSGNGAGPSVTLNSNPKFISSGGSTTLSWSSTNAVSCTASGAWSGVKATSGNQVVSNIQNNSTYTLSCSSTAGSVATSSTTVTIGSVPPPDGTIRGTCSWNPSRNEPQVNLVWASNPPPNTGAANSNGLQKGDLFPNDPNQYWGFLGNDPAAHTFTDQGVSLNTQYQYRVKYRPDLTSTNTYTVYVSTANCGGPAPTPGPLILSPSSQTVPPSVTAFLSVTGGTGSYAWEAPGGTISGAGQTIGVTYPNNQSFSVSRTVTVRSGGQTATATVEVSGVTTFQDDILLTARGNRYLLINNDDPYTNSQNVVLTLAHGFAGVASSSVQVRLSNIEAEVATASPVPFEKQISWDICGGKSVCPEGLYTVYALYQTSNSAVAPVVLDNITLLVGPQGKPNISINAGAPVTADRTVSLSLWHGFGPGVADDEVRMQVANSLDLLDVADSTDYSPSLAGWDICKGVGFECPNGKKTSYARFCARGTCQVLVLDDIDLQSAWPDWGVIINDDNDTTLTTAVALQLNPWFDDPGTKVLISNLEDLSDAVAQPFSDIVNWNLCFNRPGPCVAGTLPVYVKYINPSGGGWPSANSPTYQDDIAYTTTACVARPVCLDASPACAIAEPAEGWCPAPTPAEILINGGAAVTTSRFVTVRFNSPFDGGVVSMRPVNEASLTQRDRDVILKEYNGGINSQPTPLPPKDNPGVTRAPTAAGGQITTTDQSRSSINATPTPTTVNDLVPTDVHTELESGTARPFQTTIATWDLCQARTECLFGAYKIYVQYYRSPTLTSNGSLLAVGDEVSEVYYDAIDFAQATPTPSISATPTSSVTPTPPIVSPTGSPGGTPIVMPSWVPPIITTFLESLAGAVSVIGPLSFAAAVAVAVSAIATLIPLLGPGIVAFAYQWLMAALGLLPARKKVWGTVYDSNTKRPIAFAKVQLLDRNRRVLETRIADKDGRYGFLTTPESLSAQNVQIYIVAGQTGYLFPSKAAKSIDTFVYNNLYYGNLIEINEQTLINFDIPMDPLKPSQSPLLLKSPSIALGASVAAIADAGFWLGVIMVPLNFILAPNPFTFGTLCLFLGTASLRVFGISEHPFGVVKDQATGRPMPFALITLNDLSGKRVGFTVSDEQGRYFIVAERGKYELTVFTPASVQPTRQSKQIIEAKKGWITRELKV